MKSCKLALESPAALSGEELDEVWMFGLESEELLFDRPLHVLVTKLPCQGKNLTRCGCLD